MSLPLDSLVSPSPLPENSEERMTPVICGPRPSSVFASYDHDSHSWRTSQVSLLTLMRDEFLETWPKAGMMQGGGCYLLPKWEHRINEIDSGLWPTPRNTEIDRSKTALGVNGFNIIAKDGREWGANLATAVMMWPTPRAANPGSRPNGKGGKVLAEEVKKSIMYPTPPVDDADNSTLQPSQRVRDNLPGHLLRTGKLPGGQLNPEFVEWLMGWPHGWTDLKPLAMDKFQEWLRQHGNF